MPDGAAPEPVAFAPVLPVVVDEPPEGDAPPRGLPVPLPVVLPPEVMVAVGILVIGVHVPPAKCIKMSVMIYTFGLSGIRGLGRRREGLPLVVVLGSYARNETWPSEVSWTSAEVDAL